MFKERLKVARYQAFGSILIPDNTHNYPLLRKIIGDRPLKFPSNSVGDVVDFLKRCAPEQRMDVAIDAFADPVSIEIRKKEPSDRKIERVPGAINDISDLAKAFGVPLPPGYSAIDEKHAAQILDKISDQHMVSQSIRIKIELSKGESGRPRRFFEQEEPDDLPGPFTGIQLFGSFGSKYRGKLPVHGLAFPFDLSTILCELREAKTDTANWRIRFFGCSTCVRHNNEAEGYDRWRLWSCPTWPNCPRCHGNGILPD